MPPASPVRTGISLGVAVLTAALILPAQIHAQQERTWALTNARIETVTRGTIERGTIVIRDGIIVAVGANVATPADARVLDLSGRTVYPGVIDLTAPFGLPAARGPQGGGGGGGGQMAAFLAAQQSQGSEGGARQWTGLEPERDVTAELRLADADIRAARDAGITAVLVAPQRGALRGASALVPLGDSAGERHVIRARVAQHMGFQGVPGTYPATLLGVMAHQRQMLYDARRHGLMMDRWRANQRGMARPENDPSLEALVPVVRGERPVFYEANRENEIRRATNVAREFGLRLAVVGATEGFRAVDALRDRQVVVSVNFPRTSEVTGWAYQSAQRDQVDSARADSAARMRIEGNAAALHRAGIRFALASGGSRPGDFIANTRKAVAAGLPRDVALQALTIRAAEIAGAGDALGSIESGKIANLVITDGDLLTEGTRVREVFVDGTRYESAPAAPARAGARTAAAGEGQGVPQPGAARQAAPPPGGEDARAAAPQLGGRWSMTVSSPQGTHPTQLTVTQTGTTFEGTLDSDFGSAPIADGTIDGRTVSFSATMVIEGERVTLTFQGQYEGNRLTGTAGLGPFGAGSFTAERTP